jgi:hypothetical protein
MAAHFLPLLEPQDNSLCKAEDLEAHPPQVLTEAHSLLLQALAHLPLVLTAAHFLLPLVLLNNSPCAEDLKEATHLLQAAATLPEAAETLPEAADTQAVATLLAPPSESIATYRRVLKLKSECHSE